MFVKGRQEGWGGGGGGHAGYNFAKFSEKLHKIDKCLAFEDPLMTNDKRAKGRNRKFISNVGSVSQLHQSVVGSFCGYDVPTALAVETESRVKSAAAGSSRWLAAVSHMPRNTLLCLFFLQNPGGGRNSL